MYLVAEFLGGLLGVFWAWLVLMPSFLSGYKYKIPEDWMTPLCPTGVNENGMIEKPCDVNLDRDRSAIFFQIFGTFIFVF